MFLKININVHQISCPERQNEGKRHLNLCCNYFSPSQRVYTISVVHIEAYSFVITWPKASTSNSTNKEHLLHLMSLLCFQFNWTRNYRWWTNVRFFFFIWRGGFAQGLVCKAFCADDKILIDRQNKQRKKHTGDKMVVVFQECGNMLTIKDVGWTNLTQTKKSSQCIVQWSQYQWAVKFLLFVNMLFVEVSVIIFCEKARVEKDLQQTNWYVSFNILTWCFLHAVVKVFSYIQKSCL